MFLFNIFFFFCLGSIFASFLNLCVYRIENNNSVKGIFTGRSFCENCKKKLLWYELVPIFSFLFLKGKCSKCKKRISFFNFFTEILLGLVFASFFLYDIPPIYYLFLIILYFFAAYDFHYKSIPKQITDVILLSSFVYWLILLFFQYDINRVFSVLMFFLLALIIYLLSLKKKAFGLGDILVIAILAFWLELDLFLLTLLSSFVVGGIFSLLLVFKDRSYFKKYIPFLPFIFLGFVIANIFFLNEINLFDYIYAIW